MAPKTNAQKAAEAAAKLSAEAIEPAQPVVLDSIAEVIEEKVVPITTPQTHVPFNADQMEIIQQMIKQGQQRGVNEPLSVYGQRDPRQISTVKVSNFNGKFVVGFKDLNTNPFKKEPKYSIEKADPSRNLKKEPHVVLILSSNGTDMEELEVPLVDFMDQRMRIEVPVVHMEKVEVIKDHGVLGRIGNDVAFAVDDNGKPLQRVALKAESKEVIMKFYVQLPGFAHPVEFIGNDFLA